MLANIGQESEDMYPEDKNKIIIIETNQDARDYLRSIISGLSYITFCFEKESIFLDNLSPLNPNLVIVGSLSSERVFRLINTIKMINYSLPVLIISNDYGIKNFIDINAFTDVLTIKTHFELSEFKKIITGILKKNTNVKRSQKHPFIIGNSCSMVKIKKNIPQLSRSKEIVFISGESGTGKDLIAKHIHYKSDRKQKPFIKSSSLTFSREIVEQDFICKSQVFSVSRNSQLNSLEMANKGILFLDKIEEVPASFQAKLVQLIENNYITETWSKTKKTYDIRMIVSAGTDLELFVEKGKFRKDLYYRLNVLRIDIPPLRDRKEDIPLLMDFFTDKFCRESGKSHYELSDEIKNRFCSYLWPGNVKELENLVNKTIMLGDKQNIINKLNNKYKFQDINSYCKDIYRLAELADLKNYMNDFNKISLKDICREFVARAEKKLMKKVLKSTNWNRKKAADILNISYKSLLYKVKTYNLKPKPA